MLSGSLRPMRSKANAELASLNQQEKEQTQQLQQTENRAEVAQRIRRKMDEIRGRMKDNEDRMQELKEAHGALDKDSIQKLKDENRKLTTEHQAQRKKLDALAKAAKESQKAQQALNKTRLIKADTERRLGQLKARKDDSLTLDELKQKVERLEERRRDTLKIIEAEDTTPETKEGRSTKPCCNKRRVGHRQRNY